MENTIAISNYETITGSRHIRIPCTHTVAVFVLISGVSVSVNKANTTCSTQIDTMRRVYNDDGESDGNDVDEGCDFDGDVDNGCDNVDDLDDKNNTIHSDAVDQAAPLEMDVACDPLDPKNTNTRVTHTADGMCVEIERQQSRPRHVRTLFMHIPTEDITIERFEVIESEIEGDGCTAAEKLHVRFSDIQDAIDYLRSKSTGSFTAPADTASRIAFSTSVTLNGKLKRKHSEIQQERTTVTDKSAFRALARSKQVRPNKDERLKKDEYVITARYNSCHHAAFVRVTHRPNFTTHPLRKCYIRVSVLPNRACSQYTRQIVQTWCGEYRFLQVCAHVPQIHVVTCSRLPFTRTARAVACNSQECPRNADAFVTNERRQHCGVVR